MALRYLNRRPGRKVQTAAGVLSFVWRTCRETRCRVRRHSPAFNPGRRSVNKQKILIDPRTLQPRHPTDHTEYDTHKEAKCSPVVAARIIATNPFVWDHCWLIFVAVSGTTLPPPDNDVRSKTRVAPTMYGP